MPGVGILDPRAFFGKQLFAWYRSEIYAGLVDGAAATALLDGSDNKRDLGVSSGSPTVKTKASNSDLNGYPTVLLNGTTDRFNLADATVPADKPLLMIAVLKNTVADDNAPHRLLDFDNTQYGIGLDWTGANNDFVGLDQNSIKHSLFPADVTSWHILSMQAGPAGGFTLVNVDGIRTPVAAGGSTLTNSNLTVGSSNSSSQFWGGSFTEIVFAYGLYNTVQVQMIEHSLARKYNLTSQYKLNG